MKQSRLGSFIEALANIAVGYTIACAAQAAIFPLYNIHVPISANLSMGLIFTAVSLTRSYLIRRWFNAQLHRWLSHT